jgi:hypothetical protein
MNDKNINEYKIKNLYQLTEINLYTDEIGYIVSVLTPDVFRIRLEFEEYSDESDALFQVLLKELIEIEEYNYCAVLRDIINDRKDLFS